MGVFANCVCMCNPSACFQLVGVEAGLHLPPCSSLPHAVLVSLSLSAEGWVHVVKR